MSRHGYRFIDTYTRERILEAISEASEFLPARGTLAHIAHTFQVVHWDQLLETLSLQLWFWERLIGEFEAGWEV